VLASSAEQLLKGTVDEGVRCAVDGLGVAAAGCKLSKHQVSSAEAVQSVGLDSIYTAGNML
jgi:hypothetical protein